MSWRWAVSSLPTSLSAWAMFAWTRGFAQPPVATMIARHMRSRGGMIGFCSDLCTRERLGRNAPGRGILVLTHCRTPHIVMNDHQTSAEALGRHGNSRTSNDPYRDVRGVGS